MSCTCILMILINYSILLEFTLANSITLESHAASSIQFETEHYNGTNKLATHTIAQSSDGNHRNDVDVSSQPSDTIIADVVDQRTEHRTPSDIHLATKPNHTHEYPTGQNNESAAAVHKANQVANASIAKVHQSATIANQISNDEPSEDSPMKHTDSIPASISDRKMTNSFTNIPDILQADEPRPPPGVSEKATESAKQPANAIYFVVAVMGGAKIWSRTLSRTLSDMGTSFDKSTLGTPLKPIYVDLPANGR